jgi:hypothetical protein
LRKSQEFLKWQQEGLPNANQAITIQPIFTAGNQTISNFNNGKHQNLGSLLNPTSTAIDPIILVLPKSEFFLSDSFYLGYASQGDILIDETGLAARLQTAGVQKYVTAYNNVFASAQNGIYESQTQQNFIIFGLSMVLILILFINNLLVSIYTDNNRQLIFAQYSSGFSFFKMYGFFLLKTLSIPLVSLLICLVSGLVKINLRSGTTAVLLMAGTAVSITVFLKIAQNSINVSFLKR